MTELEVRPQLSGVEGLDTCKGAFAREWRWAFSALEDVLPPELVAFWFVDSLGSLGRRMQLVAPSDIQERCALLRSSEYRPRLR